MNRKIIMSLRVVEIVDDNGSKRIAIEIPKSDGSNDISLLQVFPDCDMERLASAAYDIIVDGGT